MANDVKNEIHVKKGIKYSEEYETYTIQMTKRKNYWWLLLLLLPLLLLIQCHKDITVRCVEPEKKQPVTGQEVIIDYDAHFLLKEGRFLPSDNIRITQTTDEQGKTVFKDLPCSVFSYIFYCLSTMDVYTQSDCYHAAETNCNFHFTRNVLLEMTPRREDLHILLLDLETSDPLPDGILVYQYEENGVVKTDSVRAEADGVATIPQMRSCGEMKLLKGICYGYADTTRMDVPCSQLVMADPKEALRLRPLKDRFTFYVKNKETRQPIPNAQCLVTLTHPGQSKTQIVRHVRTSIDGKGIAVYENAFVLSTIAIHASKYHYKDGDLESGPWTVENYIQQDDDTRTVWLEPEPFLQEFINVDSITGKPIPGVRNVIRVTNPDGTTEEYTEISNSNGVFPILTKEDAKVEVISTKDGYIQKHTVYHKFGDIKEEERIIRIQPELVTLQFRTVRESNWNILPDCDLTVSGSISGSLPPSNSGDGEFSVTMRKNELLSIVASKTGFLPNRTKVRNSSYNELFSAPQERRDIPLKSDLPPCNGGNNVPKNNDDYHERSYNMGTEEGDSQIILDFYSEADYLTIYDGVGTAGPVLVPRRLIQDDMVIPFHFIKGAVTVVIESSGTSTWKYEVSCP